MFFGVNSGRFVDAAKPHTSSMNIFGMPTAGVRVTDETAFTYSAFWACMKIISETIAYLPWRVFDDSNPQTPYGDHHVDNLLRRSPNTELNGFTFKELMMQHALGWGNFSAEIEQNRQGETVAMWPFDPSIVERDRDKKGNLVHIVSSGATSTTLEAKDVFHLRGPSRDGINGYSVIQYAKESISLGLAAEAFGASFFGNGAIPGLVITDETGISGLDENGVKNLLKSWNKKNKGPKNQNKVEYLDKGLDVKSVGLPPGDSQFVESRRMSALDMCRWFRVPPHKLADLERATHTNIEPENISFVTDSIMPWTKRAEAEADFRLLGGADSGRYYTKLNLMGLLRGDTAARREWYKAMSSLGVFTIDDILGFEDMPLVGGDVGAMRMVPANMMTPERMIKGQSQGGYSERAAKSSSMAALFEETAQRFCKIELSRIKKYSNSTTDDEIVSFYIEHAKSCANGFYRPAAVLFEHMGMGAEKIDSALAVFFGDWCGTSADQLKNALASGNYQAVLSGWETSRAQKLSRNLLMQLAEVAK